MLLGFTKKYGVIGSLSSFHRGKGHPRLFEPQVEVKGGVLLTSPVVYCENMDKV